MKIEVWSDFACPFCYIGKRRLEKALNDFEFKDEISLEFKSYELDPVAKPIRNKKYYELLVSKYGMTIEQAKQSVQQMVEQAKEAGLEYRVDSIQHSNTFDAHRLVKFAEKKGKAKEMAERLFAAYFSESKQISDHQILTELASDIGLDAEEVLDMLESSKFSKYVREEEAVAREIGVQGVPFFVFDEKYAVSGAQPTHVFKEVLDEVWKRRRVKPSFETITPKHSETSYCTDDGCVIEREEDV
ncbi:putative DsbA family dithiol-disulfide isomerase [Cerasibacillus quisquiliarum]|uniref:DSBA oxidoreductase n=1 Tax=Cerasibacillus quisquiliarum TaxID=227865 RepID=A0A511UYM4_9BACI|nr:DsbA family oxidoreductase [Cerasibacillus quisquiliarum]MBB5146930.1 putative DsbA family dithiol-disulfide isomerase [Cerasibacillus quisquiliarum]GEN31747.1 DSBA oxidoreductase [Cerasibacillus quisquiliarum]